ncbi:unnamed protein product [Candida verbasci]|uniref:4'-phosphopantetheinyl transferase domain-containing protein n=1 Tax=Candida verbasci TaxID=1227364 RepID=A0A9W4TVG1_9ASCO|nr:unnamed protein product [Candida verbasci]
MKLSYTIGIGIDIINITRFERLLEKGGTFTNRLSKRILHPNELLKFNKLNGKRKIEFITGSWASKEALFKTLDIEDQKQFNFNQWYRSYNNHGKPFIWNDAYFKNEEFHLSLSHDSSFIIATVLRQKIYNNV